MFGVVRDPKIAAGRADSFLRKANPVLHTGFWGPKRGPRRGYQWGIRFASDRARAGFLGPLSTANTKNDVFFARETVRKKFPAQQGAISGPLGAPVFETQVRGSAERAPPWGRFGVPEGPFFYRKFEK